MKRFLILLLLIVIIMFFACNPTSDTGDTGETGNTDTGNTGSSSDTPIDFTLTNHDGTSITLSDFTNAGYYVHLDFSTQTCIYCHQQAAYLTDLETELGLHRRKLRYSAKSLSKLSTLYYSTGKSFIAF